MKEDRSFEGKRRGGLDARPERRHNPFDATWHERILVLGTVFGSIAAAIVVGLVFAHDHTVELIWLVPTSFFVAGKFLPLFALHHVSSFSPYELGLVIGIMDTCTVLIIVYSLAALYHIRPVGRFLEKANRNARLVLEAYPWMRKFMITGIVLFVLFPVSGTGAIGGSFLGALLGMHRFRLIGAVSFGGFLGGLVMAFLTVRFGEALDGLEGSPYLVAAVVLLLVAGVWAMNRAYRKAVAGTPPGGPRRGDSSP